MNGQPTRKLEYFEVALRRSRGGEELADAFAAHIEEVVHLLNNNRRVAAVWRRNQGPAFIRAALPGNASQDVAIPKQVDGVSLEILLLHLADSLQSHGSPELRRTIAERSLQVMRWARECSSFSDLLQNLESRYQTQEQAHG